jgi:hypothetical protein
MMSHTMVGSRLHISLLCSDIESFVYEKRRQLSAVSWRGWAVVWEKEVAWLEAFIGIVAYVGRGSA